MFNLLRRSTRKMPARAPRSVRLGLERLETRDCPSFISLSVMYGTQKNITLWGDVTGTPNPGGLTVQFTGNAVGTATTDSNGHYSASLVALALGNVYASTTDGASNTAVVTLMVPQPKIINFGGSQGPGNVWTFSGTVSAAGGSPGLTVYFGGDPVDMQNKTTTVNQDGTFTLIVQMNGQQNDNGSVSAQTVDWWNQQSNMAFDFITQTPP
jgi:hypothetical protein